MEIHKFTIVDDIAARQWESMGFKDVKAGDSTQLTHEMYLEKAAAIQAIQMMAALRMRKENSL